MEFKKRISNKFLAVIVFLCISRVAHGQLMCYVCDNCAPISAETPQLECNDDFFNTGGSTDSSVQTTTEPSKTTAGAIEDDKTTPEETTLTPTPNSNEESTTTEETTTTEPKSTESTTKLSTENVTETTTEMATAKTTLKIKDSTQGPVSTTEQQPTSSSTVEPPQNNTGVAASTNLGTVKPLLDDIASLNNQSAAHDPLVNKDEVEDVDMEQTTTKAYIPSAEFRVRQLRSINDVTFHCFKVEATTVNGTMVVNRGCSRISNTESVCGQWEAQHPNEKMNKCYPCSRTKCNGSSAVNVSIAALIVAVVAVFMQRK